MALDERLKRELERAARPADPSGLYEHLIRRRERRRIARKVQSGVLALVVVLGSIGGFYALTRVFREAAQQDTVAPGVANGLIVVSREVPGEGEHLFAASPDGSNARKLTPNGQAVYRSPDVSPDGRTIVVAHAIPSFEPGHFVLATVPIQGGSPMWLFDEPWDISEPRWSPDGSRIAFAGSSGGPFGIYVLDVSTGDVQLVPGTKLSGISPTWSPDGSRIAFSGTGPDSESHGGTWDIYSTALDGSEITNLTNTPAVSEVQPAWSWAVDRIAFVLRSGASDASLFTMNALGGDVLEIPDGQLGPTDAEWSPDGTQIAFTGFDEVGEARIFIAGSDGTGLLVVPNIEGMSPSWQPVPEGAPVVSPSPSPTGSPLPEDAEDIGVGFPVCFTERLGGIDHLGDGTDGNAWTAVHLTDDGTCPKHRGPDSFILAVDFTGDRVADSWIDLPFECWNLCTPFDATDFDGNGTEELIVVNSFSIMDYSVFAVRPRANGDLLLEPILVAAPGHEPAGIFAGEPLRIDAGGDAGYGSTIECEGYPSAPVIVWSWSFAEIDSDEPTQVHVTRIELQPDGLFHVIDTNDFTVPAGEPSGIADPYELGPECGVDWYR